jgi:hypothetical protein
MSLLCYLYFTITFYILYYNILINKHKQDLVILTVEPTILQYRLQKDQQILKEAVDV